MSSIPLYSLTSALLDDVVLSFVDGEEAVADGGKVGTQRWKLIPAVTHQLNQLNVVGRVVGWDWRTKRRRLTSTHAHEYICPRAGRATDDTIRCLANFSVSSKTDSCGE